MTVTEINQQIREELISKYYEDVDTDVIPEVDDIRELSRQQDLDDLK